NCHFSCNDERCAAGIFLVGLYRLFPAVLPRRFFLRLPLHIRCGIGSVTLIDDVPRTWSMGLSSGWTWMVRSEILPNLLGRREIFTYPNTGKSNEKIRR